MQNNNKSTTFVYGSDDFLVDRRARIIYDTLSNGCGEIFLFEGSQGQLVSAINKAILALSTASLFDSSNTIWLRAVSFVGEQKLAEETKDLISKLFESMRSAADKKIIISASSVDKRTKIFKELSDFAETISLEYDPKTDFVASTIEQFAKENKVKIETTALNLLQMKCGNNPRLLKQEIDKLASYIFGRTSPIITQQDVAEIVDDYDSGDFFEPVESFFCGNIAKVMNSIDKYFFNNNDARPLLSSLQSRNRTLIQLKVLINTKKLRLSYNSVSKLDLANASKFYNMDDFGKSTFNVFSQNPWYLAKLVPFCINFSLPRLLSFQKLFAKTFAEISERYGEHCTVMKELAINCLCSNS